MPVGTHPQLLVVGVGNTTTVQCLARLGARRDEIDTCDPRDHQFVGKPRTLGFKRLFMYGTSAKIPRAVRPIFQIVKTRYRSILGDET
jgi:hypothetical protein